MSTFTSREFNQDVSRAKREALSEPVFVTDRGRPTHVLLSFELFRQLTHESESIVDLLAMTDGLDVDFEASRAGAGWDQLTDFGKVQL